MADRRGPHHYDVALVLTDGNPTYYGPTARGPGNFTRFIEVENGIFSANALKARDTRVLAVGIGAVGASKDNLASVVVTKTWDIDGVTRPDGEQDADFQASLVLDPVHRPDTQPVWGEEFHGYLEGDEVTVAEDQVTIPRGCTNEASGDLGRHTLSPGRNTFRIVDTVTCRTKLTLVKEISNPFPGATPVPTGAASPGMASRTRQWMSALFPGRCARRSPGACSGSSSWAAGSRCPARSCWHGG